MHRLVAGLGGRCLPGSSGVGERGAHYWLPAPPTPPNTPPMRAYNHALTAGMAKAAAGEGGGRSAVAVEATGGGGGGGGSVEDVPPMLLA